MTKIIDSQPMKIITTLEVNTKMSVMDMELFAVYQDILDDLLLTQLIRLFPPCI